MPSEVLTRSGRCLHIQYAYQDVSPAFPSVTGDIKRYWYATSIRLEPGNATEAREELLLVLSPYPANGAMMKTLGNFKWELYVEMQGTPPRAPAKAGLSPGPATVMAKGLAN